MVNRRDRLSAVFAALADPTRREILKRLRREDGQSVSAIAEPLEISLPAVSKHLKVLEEAGLVTRERQGRVHRICADIDGLTHAEEWITRYISYWERRFDLIDDDREAHELLELAMSFLPRERYTLD